MAQFTDAGPGLTNGWATSASGSPASADLALALDEPRVMVAGSYYAPATFGSLTLSGPANTLAAFVAQLGAAPLPVALTAFTATATGPPAAVRLAWATASETNSARFEVERGLDGRSFAKIGTVAAAGSSGSPRQYA